MISFSFFIRFCHYNKQFCDSQVEHFSDSWGRQKHLMTRCAVNNKPLESIIYRNRNTVIIPTDNIIISKDISVTDFKLELARKFYESFGIFKSPIIINKKNVIIDGYSSYFLARQLGMNSVDVIIK